MQFLQPNTFKHVDGHCMYKVHVCVSTEVATKEDLREYGDT